MRALAPVSIAAAMLLGSHLPAAHADATNAVGVGSCALSTYYGSTQTCTFVPTTTAVSFSCAPVNGGYGTITVSQDVFSNTQTCPIFIGPKTVAPGVPVTVTLSQGGGYPGWLEGRAYSV